MELGAVFVQPCLPGCMIDSFPVAVVAVYGLISIGPVQIVALVANDFTVFIKPVLFIIPLDPTRPRGGLAAGLSKMARGAVGVQVMAVRTV